MKNKGQIGRDEGGEKNDLFIEYNEIQTYDLNWSPSLDYMKYGTVASLNWFL